MHPPLLEQLALADFFAEGHFLRHLQRMRGEYLERRNALVDALRGELGDTVEVVPPEAGTHLVAWLPAGVDGRTVACAAVAMGLHIEPVSRYSTRPLARDGLLLGFA
ncbi:MAG TPA: PLP-dependent aminotransferase family protein, partial [Candidatus Dormibacteraeota bacterium]|nr:PLP-dependent aminotransferase family protein [Candidatus Dormibacteraeota bacterium]